MRVYLVVFHKQKWANPLVLSVWKDKHKAKAKADELDKEIHYKDRKKLWHTIEKYDIVDLEGELKSETETGDSKPSTSS